MIQPVITTALQYLIDRGSTGKAAQVRYQAIKAHVLPSRAIKDAGDYSAIRDSLWIAVYDAVFDYLSGSGYIPQSKSPLIAALSQAYIDTADTAYVDGGGDLPLDDDTAAWARGELQAQFGFVDSLFETLKALRKEGDFDANTEAANRADGYTSALDGYYNAIKLAGAGNKMLTWNLGDTEQHCDTCLELDGGRHRASWYSSRGYFPRKPGSQTDCGGWRCDCSLQTDEGEEFTI